MEKMLITSIFSYSHNVFTLPKTIFNVSVTFFFLSSTYAFNLQNSKNLSFGTELHKPCSGKGVGWGLSAQLVERSTWKLDVVPGFDSRAIQSYSLTVTNCLLDATLKRGPVWLCYKSSTLKSQAELSVVSSGILTLSPVTYNHLLRGWGGGGHWDGQPVAMINKRGKKRNKWNHPCQNCIDWSINWCFTSFWTNFSYITRWTVHLSMISSDWFEFSRTLLNANGCCPTYVPHMIIDEIMASGDSAEELILSQWISSIYEKKSIEPPTLCSQVLYVTDWATRGSEYILVYIVTRER